MRKIFAAVMGSSLSQQSAVNIIRQWPAVRAPPQLIFDAGRRDVTQYFEAVDRLLQTPREFRELISTAMDRLRTEFSAVVRRQADYHAAAAASTVDWSSVTDSTANQIRYEDYELPEPISADVIAYLRNITERMNSVGRIEDCVRVYRDLRNQFLRIQLTRLRVEELNIGGSRRRYLWDELKVKMESWIQVSQICVEKLFRREKQQCDEIFGDNPAKEQCFVETVQEFAMNLFRFVETVNLNKQQPERMETILAFYDTFLRIKPTVDEFFSSESGREIRQKCAEISTRIIVDVRSLFYEFESTVLHDSSPIDRDTGEVHKSTIHVINLVDLIVGNRKMLTNLMNESPSFSFGDVIIPQHDLEDMNRHTFLEQHLILIILLLQRNLKSKSGSYQDPLLKQLFLINNICFFIQRIEESRELKEMIGETSLNKLNSEMRFEVDSFKALICSRFLNCFEENGLYRTGCFKSRPSKTAVRRRIATFNSVFDETRSVSWTVLDPLLREDIRVSVSETLVFNYTKFIDSFEREPEISRILINGMYSADELKILILEEVFGDR